MRNLSSLEYYFAVYISADLCANALQTLVKLIHLCCGTLAIDAEVSGDVTALSNQSCEVVSIFTRGDLSRQ